MGLFTLNNTPCFQLLEVPELRGYTAIHDEKDTVINYKGNPPVVLLTVVGHNPEHPEARPFLEYRPSQNNPFGRVVWIEDGVGVDFYDPFKLLIGSEREVVYVEVDGYAFYEFKDDQGIVTRSISACPNIQGLSSSEE